MLGLVIRIIRMNIPDQEVWIFTRNFLKACLIVLGWLGLSFFYPGHEALAQSQPNVTSSSSFLPVGSGSRAIGMGGAFIAIADDATAASWNPAGLTQLKRPEISLVGSLFIRHDHSTFDTYPEASASSTITKDHMNYLSLVCPGHFLGRNIVLSLNYQHLYDMDLHSCRTWHYRSQAEQGYLAVDMDITWKYVKEGALGALSPALAIQVNPALAVGLAVNFWPQSLGSSENGWRNNVSVRYTGMIDEVIPDNTLVEMKDNCLFSGTNFHLGFRLKINSIITLGGVMKTSFSAHLDHEYESRIVDMTVEPESVLKHETRKEEETLIMPPSYGLGLAARISDRFTLSLDLYRTEWEKHVLHTREGTYSAVTDDYAESSRVRPTHTVRLGSEYLIIAPRMIIPFRAGLFYDPDPSKNHPQDFYGFSLGSGLAWWKVAFDLAYQFRFTQNAATISFQGETDHNRIRQHILYLSAIYYL